VDARTELKVDHIEVWVLMGTPGELGTFTKTHAKDKKKEGDIKKGSVAVLG